MARTFAPHPMSLAGGGIDVCDASRPVLIPRIHYDDPIAPGWMACVAHSTGLPVKPTVRCKCGRDSGIGLHHVHADGRVMNSFFDSQAVEFEHKGKKYRHPPGCGWHVYIKLDNYDQGEFPPVD